MSLKSSNFFPHCSSSCRWSVCFCCPLCQTSFHHYLEGLQSWPAISSKSPVHVLPTSAFSFGSGTALNSHICRQECEAALNKQLLIMKASLLALFIACPEPFSLHLSKQVLMCNPISVCRKLPLSQHRGLVVQLQLSYPLIVTAGLRAPRCCSARLCALELPGVFHCHCYTP